MRISEIQIRKNRMQLKEPLKVAFGVVPYSENVLVRVSTDEGITGYGEAAPLAFVTGETCESVIAALEMFKRTLTGMDSLNLEGIHAAMDGACSGNTSAKCAIDLAMYDIWGKASGLPVYRLLGGADGKVINDITIGIGRPEKMAEKAKHHVENGYGILKIKAGLNVEEDIRAVRMIREAVGEKVRLRVDANQGYDVAAALKALEGFVQYRVESVEQCLPAWDIEGAAYLRKKAPAIDLMLDESIHSPYDAARACRMGAADILNIKLMKCGGLYPALKIQAIAESFGKKCMVGCMMESRLSITAGLSLASAKNNIPDADCDSFAECTGEISVEGGFEFKGQEFCLENKPGLGVEVEELF